MVSPDIQGLGLNDDLLEHYRKEVGEMALGILDGKPFDSPVHEGILLTCMLEILPYDDSDNSEFSQERFHSYMSELMHGNATPRSGPGLSEIDIPPSLDDDELSDYQLKLNTATAQPR